MATPALEERKKRLESVKRILDGLVPISYVKALATVEVNFGVRRELAKEYIRTVTQFYGFEITNGEIRKKTEKKGEEKP